MAKSIDAFRTIGEVSETLSVPKHVLRFWENRFPQLKPMKRGGGRRYYRPEDVELLVGIHALLHGAGYTIKGVQRILREDGVETVKAAGRGDVPKPAAAVGKVMGAPRASGLAKAKNPVALTPELRAHLLGVVKELEACLALAKSPIELADQTAEMADEAPISVARKVATKKKRA
ncbi:MAG: MerR family transcriptional regulator [Hyphomicrobiaceae bacterium]